MATWGKSTGCTLRLTQIYHGTSRTIVGDSWFASVNTALAMKKHGLYFVGNVKNGHFGFPLKFLKESCVQRGDQKFLYKDWPLMPSRNAMSAPEGTGTVRVWAGGHCDKKPTNLVATRGKSTPGEPAVRTFRGWSNGELITHTY